jgi:REP element-mobilizing transposase RayT
MFPMPNTYTQLYIQFVFAVQHRKAMIQEPIREEIHRYLTGIANNNGHKMLAVYCMPDHAHIFVGLNPNQSISSLANDLKSNSSKWINEKKLFRYKFNWQNGYGAFSYHKGMLSTICQYIETQPEHHQKWSFQDEYLNLLREFDVDFNDHYLFEFFD